jgi:anti-sigma B factor antagonist
MSLQFELGKRGDAASVRLLGVIDRDAGDALDDAYRSATDLAPASIDLDFSGVEYINSTGIALIVGLLAKARAAAITVRAAGLTAHYLHIFEITRLSDFIEIVQPVGGATRVTS